MSKVEKLKEKYKGSVPTRTFNILAENDITPTKKYLDYMCNQWISVRNSSTVSKTVMEFDSLLPYIENKDIYSSDYSAFFDLMVAITNAKEVKEEKTFKKEEHVDVIYEDDTVLLLSPKTHRGSLKYGASTKWCTASKEYPGHFTRYKRDGYLYYLIRKQPKNSEWDKVAFYKSEKDFTSEVQIYKANDTSISGGNIIKYSDWDLTTIMHMHLLIEANIIQHEVLKNAKGYISDVLQKVNSIEGDKLSKMIKIVGVENTDVIQDLLNTTSKLKEVLDSVKV